MFMQQKMLTVHKLVLWNPTLTTSQRLVELLQNGRRVYRCESTDCQFLESRSVNEIQFKLMIETGIIREN